VDILNQIVDVKRGRVEAAQRNASIEKLREDAATLRQLKQPHALVAALNSSAGVNVIAEFKRKSPSRGEIRSNVNPATMARFYENGGARAISVLTEEDYFAGSADDLGAVRAATTLPILRKDFIFTDYQIYESAAMGADAVLLIASVLDGEQLEKLRQLAEDELNMDALVEVHDEAEMQRAINAGGKLIGVNNRDLRTFKVSIETSLKLAAIAPKNTTLVSESGLNNRADLKQLSELGYRGFLIGESLMRSENPEFALRALTSEDPDSP
jgi:indole-3-glycerol phosphate synthase